MQLGSLGQLTLVNGDLHVELDLSIGGTAEAPLTADIKVDELLALLEADVSNQYVKMALGLVIGLVKQAAL